MTKNRQHLADLPLKTRGRSWRLTSAVRYWSRQIAFSIAPLRRRFEREVDKNAAAQWDALMSDGGFETYLGGTINVDACNEMTSLMIKYRATANPSVLDVGCCGGTLLTSLEFYSRYRGTDISKIAINEARADPALAGHIASGRVEFEVIDLRSYHPTPSWDVVVFNEVLYYLKPNDAEREFSRYAAALNPSGIVIVSMKDDAKSRIVFGLLLKRYRWIDGMLWQRKATTPSYGVAIDRERPAFLLGVFAKPVQCPGSSGTN